MRKKQRESSGKLPPEFAENTDSEDERISNRHRERNRVTITDDKYGKRVNTSIQEDKSGVFDSLRLSKSDTRGLSSTQKYFELKDYDMNLSDKDGKEG